jgi:hypothetical protein
MAVELRSISGGLLEAHSNVVDHMQQLQTATELGYAFGSKRLKLEG